jgi:hypothetical protein
MSSINDIMSQIKNTEDAIKATMLVLRTHQDKLMSLQNELEKAYSEVTSTIPTQVKVVNPICTLDKHLVQRNWPFMRVKNTIKYLRLGTTRISHYDGLKLLADKKGITIQALINMNLLNYTGSDAVTRGIMVGSMRAYRFYSNDA